MLNKGKSVARNQAQLNNKRKREDGDQSLSRQVRTANRQAIVSRQATVPGGASKAQSTLEHNLPDIVTRAESVAADNGTPRETSLPKAHSGEP